MIEKINFSGFVILFAKVMKIDIPVVDKEEMNHFLVVIL
jgi:hypothetical protein